MLKLPVVATALLLVFSANVCSQTHRAVVVFDDKDPETVPANNRAAVRFQFAISDALVKGGVQVFDPALLAGSPLQIRVEQPDAKLRSAILAKSADGPIYVIQLTIFSSATSSGDTMSINIRTSVQLQRFANSSILRSGAFEIGVPKTIEASCARKRDCLLDELGNALVGLAPLMAEEIIKKISR